MSPPMSVHHVALLSLRCLALPLLSLICLAVALFSLPCLAVALLSLPCLAVVLDCFSHRCLGSCDTQAQPRRYVLGFTGRPIG